MSRAASAAPDVRAAYRHCEHVTRTQARNFAYGIALLPPAKRRALSAVYAYARRIDDIGDGELSAELKLAALADARSQVSELVGGSPPPADDPVLIGLSDAGNRFAIPLEAFAELIDGCEADVRGARYRTFEELKHYCRCVAGSIGRLSLGVFGSANPEQAAPLADSLGVALQLTNILRDIREDLAGGRVYLPAEDLEQFGCALTPGEPGSLREAPEMEKLIRYEAERARGWYATGLRLMPLLDRRSAASAGAMAGIYRRLLEHIEATPSAVLERRMSLSGREKLKVAAGCLAETLRPGRRAGHVPSAVVPGDRGAEQ